MGTVFDNFMELEDRMKIFFKNSRIKKLCDNEKELKKRFPNAPKQIALVKRRLEMLKIADNLMVFSNLPSTPSTRLHKLSGDRNGQFAIDLYEKERLIIEPEIEDPETERLDDLRTIHCICVIEIVDYH